MYIACLCTSCQLGVAFGWTIIEFLACYSIQGGWHLLNSVGNYNIEVALHSCLYLQHKHNVISNDLTGRWREGLGGLILR